MTRHQRTVLVACILATAVVLVDSTVVNVALPAIERELGGGLAGQQWASNAYLLTLGALHRPRTPRRGVSERGRRGALDLGPIPAPKPA